MYDFQSAEIVFDLDNYKDITHFHGQINDWMVSCFARGEYLADTDRIKQSNAKLRTGVDAFADTFNGRLSGAAETD